MSVVQFQLQKLHQCLGVPSLRDTAVNVIVDLKNSTPGFQDKEIAYVSSLLFHHETGVLAFAQQSIHTEEFQKAREECLEFLLMFLDRIHVGVQNYAVQLKNSCIALYSMSKRAKTQEQCLLNIQKVLFASVFQNNLDLEEWREELLYVMKILQYYQDDGTENHMQVEKLVDMLLLESAKASKASFSSRVKQSIYQLLGFVAKKYPEYVVTHEKKILNMFLIELKQSFRKKLIDQCVIEGCLVGLSYFIYSFTLSYDEHPHVCKEIFTYMLHVLNLKNQQKERYSAAKAALTLLKENTQQFAELLYEDYVVVFERLCFCARHHNRELNNLGMKTLDCVMLQVALVLKKKLEENNEESKQAFMFFMDKFHHILESSQSTVDILIAVEGYGAFALPCKIILGHNEVKQTYINVLSKTKQLFLSNKKVLTFYDDELRYLPRFLESLANILREFEEIDSISLKALEDLVIFLVENFPYLVNKLSCYRCILIVLLSLYTKGTIFRTFLSKIVFKCLLHMCSLPVYSDVELANAKMADLVEKDPRKVTYKNYVPLWNNLLACIKMKDLNYMDCTLADKKMVTELLYDEIIGAVWMIIDHLDFSICTVTTQNFESQKYDTLGSVNEDVMQASNPMDHQILSNVVSFCMDLLPSASWQLFGKWVPSFSQQVVILCSRHIYVSSLYKMMALCLKMCHHIHYFKNVACDNTFDQINTKSEKAELKTTFLLISKFVREIYSRLCEFKGELLVSCLHLLLNLPPEIVLLHIPALTGTIKIALKLGLSYTPLALSCVDALETWRLQLPEEKLFLIYVEILPLLWEYMIICIDMPVEKASQQVHKLNANTVTSAKRRQLLVVKAVKLNKELFLESEKELGTICHRILLLLGSLGGITSRCVREICSKEVNEKLTAWDSRNHLLFSVPFFDLKAIMALDEFLPRTCELAVSSGDRKTKIAACELLHAMVLFMVGTGASKTDQLQKKYPMDRLFLHVFPVILQLACDPDEVTMQLFKPLVMQLIHWFSNNQTFESRETAALLNALMAGVIDPSNLALRVFCAEGIQEFLTWSIKQSPVDKVAKRMVNTKMLMKRIYSYCLHPNPTCRLGAALMFNSIYIVFREDEDLVNIFTFEILVHFVNSLAMTHRDEKSQGSAVDITKNSAVGQQNSFKMTSEMVHSGARFFGKLLEIRIICIFLFAQRFCSDVIHETCALAFLGTQKNCVEALCHLERIVVGKAALFNKHHHRRRLAGGLKETTLSGVVQWLLEKCGQLQTSCRHECMKLVCKFAPHITGFQSVEKYFHSLAKKGLDYFVAKFEGGNSDVSMSLRMVSSLSLSVTMTQTILWFDALLASLDCYLWVFGEQILAPRGVFAGNKSNIFTSLMHFIETFAFKSLMEEDSMSVHTPKEIDEYNFTKCTVIVRCFGFISIILGNSQKDSVKVFPEEFWSLHLWHLVTMCIFKPADAGFNVSEVEVVQKLPSELEKLLRAFQVCLPQPELDTFREHLISQFNLIIPTIQDKSFIINKNDDELMNLISSMEGVKMLLKHGYDVPLPITFSTNVLQMLLNVIVDNVNGSFAEVVLRPVQLTLARKILEIFFVLKTSNSHSCLVDALFDAELVHQASGQHSSTRGELFYTMFCKPLSEHIVAHAAAIIPLMVQQSTHHVVLAINLILDEVVKSKELKKRYGRGLLQNILVVWSRLREICHHHYQCSFSVMLQHILYKMMLIDPKVVRDTKQPSFRIILDDYTSAITNATFSTLPEGCLMELLPFFCLLDKCYLEKLKLCMHDMSAKNFPLDSSEFLVGGYKYNEYTSIFRKILEAFEASGCCMLLEFIMSIVCREKQHCIEDEIQNSLMIFVQRLSSDAQNEATNITFKIFMNENLYSADMRIAAAERFCIPILSLSRKEVIVTFFKEHVKEIMSSLQLKVKHHATNIEELLVTKIGCLMLMQLLYRRLSKDDLNTAQSAINKAFFDNTDAKGSELTQEITKISHLIKKETMQEIKEIEIHRELCRRLQCSAYNTLVSVICCTQTDAKYYTTFLFTENERKGEYLWDNLVAHWKNYSFDLEKSTLVKKKQFFTSFRESYHVEIDEKYPGTSDSGISLHYLSSQYLSMSSFSEEVTCFDFTSTSKVMTEVDDESKYSSFKRAKRQDESVAEKSNATVGETFELELDELNEHECMPTIISLLKHMSMINLIPTWAEDSCLPVEMPSWMSGLHKKIISDSTHSNIKLFIAKVVINNKEIFKPFAGFWLQPLMLLIATKAAGQSINDFIYELMETLLSWSSVAVPKSDADCEIASQVLKFLMETAHHSHRIVIRTNLEVIKTTVKCWKSGIKIPVSSLYEMIKKPEGFADGKNSLAIQLIAIAVHEGFSAYSSIKNCTEDTFLSKLVNHVTFKSKEIHCASAEVIGMILGQFASSGDGEKEAKLVGIVLPVMENLYSSSKDKFLKVLRNIEKHYAPLAQRFLKKLLFMLPNVHSIFQILCLDILSNHVQTIENAFVEFKTKNILGFLTHRIEDIQLAALRIVQEMLQNLKPEELEYLIGTVTDLLKCSSVAVRKMVYETCEQIYNVFREASKDDNLNFYNIARNSLVSGLGDSDFSLRLMNINFWIKDIGDSSSTVERALAVVNNLYLPSTEHQFLNYATYILLQNTSQSPDFRLNIFSNPLSECHFTDYAISSSWHDRHSGIVTQLFVDSAPSQMHKVAHEADLKPQRLRVTQKTVAFSRTQDVAGDEKTFNWLTQSTVSTDSSLGSNVRQTEASTLCCFDSTLRIPHQYGSKAKIDSTLVPTNVERFGERFSHGEELYSNVKRSKLSLVKDTNELRNMFARKKILEQVQREKEEIIVRKKQQSEVTLYRTYRKGDLPDIEIPNSAIIVPLQVLAQRDKITAEKLFCCLFKSILEEIDKSVSKQKSEDVYTELLKFLNTMLKDSTMYSSSLVGAILHISFYCCGKFKLNIENLTTACIASNQEELGILLLEEYLTNNDVTQDERPSKRARKSIPEISGNLEEWLKLAELYKRLENYDVVRGIIELKFGSRKSCHLALEAESRKDYCCALEHYSMAINSSEQPEPLQAEYDYWDDAIMKCYNNLTQWEDLAGYTIKAFTDDRPELNQIWNDSYYQEHYLPHVIHSKLKLFVNGNDEQKFLKFIHEALLDHDHPHKAALLKVRHAEDLSLMFIVQHDYNQAMHYLNRALENFLQEWVTKSSQFIVTQKYNMEKLQSLSDMHSFLLTIKDRGTAHYSKHLLSTWNRFLPNTLDSVITWDDVVINRQLYIDHLRQHKGYSNFDGNENKQSLDNKNLQFRLTLFYADSMIKQGNVQVALKLLHQNHSMLNQLHQPILEMEWTHAYVRANHFKMQSESIKAEYILNPWIQLNKLNSSNVLQQNSQLACSHHLLHARSAELFAVVVKKYPDILKTLDDTRTSVLKEYLGEVKENTTSNEILEQLGNLFIRKVKEAISSCDGDAAASSSVAKAHLKLALYCNQHLYNLEDVNSSLSSSPQWEQEMPKIIIESMLEAVRLNDMTARQYFPRLLQLLELHPHTIDFFKNKVTEIPPWMFLKWSSQMIVLLDKPEAPAVQDIIMSLVNLYPQAMIYLFKLSNERFSFSDDDSSRKRKAVVEKIQTMLCKLHVVDEFIQALYLMTNFDCLFRDYCGKIATLKKHPKPSTHRIIEEVARMWGDIVEFTDERSSYRSSMLEKFKKKIETNFGKNGCKILKYSAQEFIQKFSSLLKEIQQESNKNVCLPLKSYSTWFEDFASFLHSDELEIPGQYTGDQKPLVEYNVTVAGFDPKVLSLASMRMPKRIIIRGNDDREYCFLVKSGEDLRTDQRIEQLFAIMNHIYKDDPVCSSLDINIITYQVIPLTLKLGLVEWVDNAVPLQNFLQEAVEKQEYESAMSEVQNILQALGKKGGWNHKTSPPHVQCKAIYSKYTYSDLIPYHWRMKNAFSQFLLRKGLMKLSSCLESYFCLRNSFLMSHAVLCISQYILGIGDRHLSNFMVACKTGKMIGIDFGHCFGSATQFLPIPELMPFRLTHQLQRLLEPLGKANILQPFMIHALNALRAKPQILLNTMDVFIKEPTVDWLDFAKKQMDAGQAIEEDESDVTWYPRQRISFAKRKLEGGNPAYITKEELALGHSGSEVYQQMLSTCMGNKERNIRARMPALDLSPENQVECLIDQATDENLLARTYHGWRPWM